jgi:hypothetical protein
VWWCLPLILVLWRLRQEDSEFKAILGYIDTISKKKGKEKMF